MVALQHVSIILLLLVGLLDAQPRIHAWARWAVWGGLALALIAPAWPLALPWQWVAALVIPLLLWQTAQRVTSARWPTRWADLGIWLWVSVGISVALSFTAGLIWLGAALFGLLAASMMWRAVTDNGRPSVFAPLGSLVLAFLLVEVTPTVESPSRYVLALAGGAGLGALIGYAGVHLGQRLKAGSRRDILSIGQVYVAYGAALLVGASSVAAAMLSAAVYVAYGAWRGQWTNENVSPRPMDSWPIFGLAAVALAFFSWQTHVPLTPTLLLEAGLGLLVVVVGVWIGRVLHNPAFSPNRSLIRVVGCVGCLLVPALLLWPREALLEAGPLAVALAAAGLVSLGTHIVLTPLLSLYAWLDEAGVRTEHPDKIIQGLAVRDAMKRDYLTVRPETPMAEVARLLSEHHLGAVLVTEADGRLAGIVTEDDLFVKEEQLPRSGQTYLALFREPVVPEQLPQVYSERATRHATADVMTRKIMWVKEGDSVGRAVRVMVQFDLRQLPVFTADPDAGGKLTGILTRADIVSLLSRAANQKETASPDVARKGDD
jgi:CBS domain-containing protein